jgi:biotin--protein ligase
MNVLIYDGPGVTNLQKQLLSVLKGMLGNYDVMLVSETILNNSPWENTTKLIVMPGGRDLLFLSALDPHGIRKIKDYVERGGNYLGLCAGAYFACSEIEFELHRPFYEVIGPRPLQFIPGKAVGSVAANFHYGTELGAQAMKLQTQHGDHFSVYVNGGPCFRLTDHAEVIASYESGEPAIVKTKVGKGTCLVSGPHIEVSSSYVQDQIQKLSEVPEREADVHQLRQIVPALEASETQRHDLLKYILKELGLEVSDPSAVDTEHIVIYVTALDENDILFLQHQFSVNGQYEEGVHLVKDKETSWCLIQDKEERCKIKNSQTGIIFYRDQETPKFDITKYQFFRKTYALDTDVLFGNVLLYAEVIGSTQTTLDNNPWLSETLPAGVVFLASHQTAGRGRGNNTWISNHGCLQFSLRIEHFSVNSVIFLQYLFGLAVVQGVQKTPGCETIPIHLKWPNDIYLNLDGALKKIGGILVTSEWFAETASFRVTIGCGLNVLNTKPSACLQDVATQPLQVEMILAAILAEFQTLYHELIHQLPSNDMFGIFRERYYKSWLHT